MRLQRVLAQTGWRTADRSTSIAPLDAGRTRSDAEDVPSEWMSIDALRLKPPQPTALGDYVLDRVAIELGDDETQLDFRLELGQGLGIYWALPAARHDRLRLAHVDGAAYQVDEPELIADPWTCDLTLAFEGELGVLGNGRTLGAIRIEVTSQPPAYACELVTRRGDADELVTRLSWRADDPWLNANAAKRVTLLDDLIGCLAAAPDLDLGAIARACEEGGRLFDAGYLDGAQYSAIRDLHTAARSASPDLIRAALRRCRTWEPPPPAPAPSPALLAIGPVVPGHRAVITPPVFAPDGVRFVAGDERGVLIVHERRGATWVEAARAKAPAAVRGVAWSPDGRRIAMHDRLGIRLRAAADLTEEASAPHVGDGPIAFGANGAWLAALGRGSLQILAVPSLARRSLVMVSDGQALAADPKGNIAVVVDGGATEETAMGAIAAREPATIVVFEVESGKRVTIVPEGPVRGLVQDRVRGHLIANSFGRAVTTWTSSGELVRTFEPYDVPVRALDVTDRWLIMIPDRPHGEATLDLWSRDSLERRASVAIPGGFAPDWVVASPDGRTLLTRELPVGDEFGIRVWRVDG